MSGDLVDSIVELEQDIHDMELGLKALAREGFEKLKPLISSIVTNITTFAAAITNFMDSGDLSDLTIGIGDFRIKLGDLVGIWDSSIDVENPFIRSIQTAVVAVREWLTERFIPGYEEVRESVRKWYLRTRIRLEIAFHRLKEAAKPHIDALRNFISNTFLPSLKEISQAIRKFYLTVRIRFAIGVYNSRSSLDKIKNYVKENMMPDFAATVKAIKDFFTNITSRFDTEREASEPTFDKLKTTLEGIVGDTEAEGLNDLAEAMTSLSEAISQVDLTNVDSLKESLYALGLSIYRDAAPAMATLALLFLRFGFKVYPIAGALTYLADVIYQNLSPAIKEDLSKQVEKSIELFDKWYNTINSQLTPAITKLASETEELYKVISDKLHPAVEGFATKVWTEHLKPALDDWLKVVDNLTTSMIGLVRIFRLWLAYARLASKIMLTPLAEASRIIMVTGARETGHWEALADRLWAVNIPLLLLTTIYASFMKGLNDSTGGLDKVTAKLNEFRESLPGFGSKGPVEEMDPSPIIASLHRFEKQWREIWIEHIPWAIETGVGWVVSYINYWWVGMAAGFAIVGGILESAKGWIPEDLNSISNTFMTFKDNTLNWLRELGLGVVLFYVYMNTVVLPSWKDGALKALNTIVKVFEEFWDSEENSVGRTLIDMITGLGQFKIDMMAAIDLWKEPLKTALEKIRMVFQMFWNDPATSLEKVFLDIIIGLATFRVDMINEINSWAGPIKKRG